MSRSGALERAAHAVASKPGLEAEATALDGILQDGLLGGVPADDLVARFGSPLYVYDLDLIGRRVAALRAVLPLGFRVAFAVKSNPALAVLAFLARLGVGADVASGGELETVLRAGFAPGAVAMTGPGKRVDELAAAVAAGVGVLTVESPGELRRLEEVAAGMGRRQPILLRLAVDEDARLEQVELIGGGGGKFGMPLGDLREAARYAAASPHFELLGVHAFGASNVRDADALARHVTEIVAIGRDVAAEAGVSLRLVDAGGGLGIPYADGESPLDLARYGALLADLRRTWDGDPALRATEVLIEPGRFLVGPAGAYLARVVDVKGTHAAPVAILDGGINHAVRPALVRQQQRLALLAGDAEGRDRVPVTVAGPLCTGLDVFGAAVQLPRPRVGDVLALLDAGAYGFTESMPLFLSHGMPAEVAIRSGEARLIRPRLGPTELLDRQIAPDWRRPS